MKDAGPDEVTVLLAKWRQGSEDAQERLMEVVQSELRRLAASYLRRERPGHTLQPTAVVNEAYLRLMPQRGVRWENRAHFFAVSAQIMRRILVDYARQSHSAKRGGAAQKVTLDEQALVSGKRSAALVALDEAMHALAEVHPRRTEVVELRYFGGLNNQEIAEVLKVSETTVERDWRFAKAWLYRELQQ